MSLYRQLLGASFDLLPEAMQRFFEPGDIPGAWSSLSGTMEVRRAKGPLGSTLADLARLPNAGATVPVRITVVANQERQRWTRCFGDARIDTRQWRQRSFLVEQCGRCRFAYRVSCSSSSLRYEFHRAWLLGIPLPRKYGIWCSGIALDRGERWRMDFRVESMLLGLIGSYSGEVELDHL